MPSLYALCILLSAFLLFQVQPMIAKVISPWFGGTPAVWSTVQLFFQTVLIGGYAYAYWLLGRVREKRQGLVHGFLLALAAGLLVVTALTWPSPLTPGDAWRPGTTAQPIWEIFKLLAVSVGVPYFLLSSNSTLMQAWFGRDNPSRPPYRLYALSNIGSLLALVSFPFLFEPILPLRAHAYLWAAAFGVYAVLAAYLALRTSSRAAGQAAATDPVDRHEAAAEKPARSLYPLWLALAAVPSSMLISVTSQITQEVAVIPFLWVLPLAVYLLTFILAFSGWRVYSRPVYAALFFAASLFSFFMLFNIGAYGIITQIIVFTLLLFLAGMICHSELYRLRPHPRFLPTFYLLVAVGGAIGGSFAALLAPVIFQTGLWELQWGLVACGLLLTFLYARSARSRPAQAAPTSSRRRGSKRTDPKARAQGQSAPALRRLLARPGVILSALALGLLTALTIVLMTSGMGGELLSTRNFYGVLRVWEINNADDFLRANQVTHGRTVHGSQFQAAELRELPTTFYSLDSGLGTVISSLNAPAGSRRVGTVGLGVGVIATYGQPGDEFRFYEINPDVIELAEGEGGYFSFLTDSDAEIVVVAGDGRVSLERELEEEGSQQFDLLVLDAFSGDAVPLHLLTREAFEIYLQHIQPDGVIAIHVSNRYFNLHSQIFRMADELGLQAELIEHRGDGIESYDSRWMFLTRSGSFLETPAVAERAAQRPSGYANLRVWTDDYSNLLSLLR